MIDVTCTTLTKAGFQVSSIIGLRSICFDVVGRKDGMVLVIKVLGNVDALSRSSAEEIKTMAGALEAHPVLIGASSSSGPLEKGIVYSRFKIPMISNDTLADHLLEEVPPFIFAAPGGLYVNIDGPLLRELRESRNISLSVLAETAGVSRRTIQMYETGMGAIIDAALKLEEFLCTPMIQPVDPFGYKGKDGLEYCEIRDGHTGNRPLDHMFEIGFSVVPVTRGPFDAVTKSQATVFLTGLGSDDKKLRQKASAVSDISDLIGKHAVIIVNDTDGVDSIKSTALISDRELEKIDDKNDLIDLVFTRSTKK